MMSETARTAPYRKDVSLDALLEQMNEMLRPLHDELVTPFSSPRYPTVFVVGAPRSGTTLLVQVLVRSFQLGYISNVASRFWLVPYIGVRLAQALKGQTSSPPAIHFASDLGSTPEYEGPHEFGYFWRRWLPYEEPTHQAPAEDLKRVDTNGLRREVAAVESVFDRPFLFKNPVCSLHVEFLARIFPDAVFIDCIRDPLYTAASLLRSRRSYYGTEDAWFSIKPPVYQRISNLRPVEQVAAQLYSIRTSLREAQQEVRPTRFLTVSYERLCADPNSVLDRFVDLLERAGHAIRRWPTEPPTFRTGNDPDRLPQDEEEALRHALAQYPELQEEVRRCESG